MSRIHLLRHAMPELLPDVPPSAWPLTAEGRSAATALAGLVPAGATFVASDERKAQETLALATHSEHATDSRFGEVRRPEEPIAAEVRAARRAWVAGRPDARHAGWETREGAAARFHAGLADHLPGELVVATHGMVMTAWLVSIGHVAAGEPAAAFWEALQLPDLVTVDID